MTGAIQIANVRNTCEHNTGDSLSNCICRLSNIFMTCFKKWLFEGR